MDPSITVAIISSAVSLVAATLLWRSSGRATNVNEQAAQLAWVKEIRQDATDARQEVETLQAKVRELSRQLDIVSREADHWITRYQLLHRTAWRPGVTLEQLRDMLGQDMPGAERN